MTCNKVLYQFAIVDKCIMLLDNFKCVALVVPEQNYLRNCHDSKILTFRISCNAVLFSVVFGLRLGIGIGNENERGSNFGG